MLHLTTHYSDNNARRAEVFRMEDDTYVVYLFEGEFKKHHIYYDVLDDAEDRAEEFVLL